MIIIDIESYIFDDKKVKDIYQQDMDILLQDIMEHTKKFELQLGRMVISHVSSRLKSEESLKKKLKHKGFDFTKDNSEYVINDLAGIRVVCLFIDDLYYILDYIILNEKYDILKIKDFVRNPKDSGYQSIHVIVQCEDSKKIEIQLRTMAMDCWAVMEYQLQYKAGKDKKDLKKQLKKCASIAAKFDDKMMSLKNSI